MSTIESELFETPRLELLKVCEEDAPLLLAVWNDPSFIEHVSDRGIRTLEQAHKAIVQGPLKTYREYGYGPYKMLRKSDGEALGICGLFKRDYLEDPDLGYAVLPGYRGAGYASEAARQVLVIAAIAFDLPRVKALISPDNAASIQLIEKIGFKFLRRCKTDENEDALLYGFEFDGGSAP
ncbi:MAG: GNAT family N-acetyltransferase [Pseudomonadota bacterium]